MCPMKSDSQTRPSFLPLFLVSAASVGFEIQLTRFFAIASWAEYGYWVISIVMVGFSMSGVALSVFGAFFRKRSASFLSLIPWILPVAAVLGFYAATLVPFNPLELQNKDLWQGQLWNIGKYYLALFPYFFLADLFIGLNFISFQKEVPRLYTA